MIIARFPGSPDVSVGERRNRESFSLSIALKKNIEAAFPKKKKH